MARLGSVSHMEDLLRRDTVYGDTARLEIERLRKEGKPQELEAFIKTVYARRENMDRAKSLLSQRPY